MPKNPLTAMITLLMLLCIAMCASLRVAHADDLSEGLELAKQKRYEEATPLLEKAAKEGHDEALEALDKIYEKDAKASPEAKVASPAISEEAPVPVEPPKKAIVSVASVASPQTIESVAQSEETATTSNKSASYKYYIKLIISLCVVFGIGYWLFRRIKSNLKK